MRKFISSIKYLNTRSIPPSQEGCIHTLNAIEKLYCNLKKNNITTFSTRHLNQDSLENFFRCVRYNCRSNTNPTIPQFIAGIQTAIVSNLRHTLTGQKTNCENDTAQIADNLTSYLKVKEKSITEHSDMSEITYDIDFEKMAADAVEEVQRATPETQSCAYEYVCGFILKKLRNNKCVHCKNSFLTASDEEYIFHIYTSFKETNLNTTSLNYVHKNVVKNIEALGTEVT